MDLEQWQKRLESHFRELSEQKRREAPDGRIFALEHGLDRSEVEALRVAVRAHIVHSPPSPKHALAWIVYATEIGYRYSGDEYWHTFEKETPGWTDYGNRYWIRSCFLRFQREFFGVVPSGAWARHFSIICWPITHAILPKDLQRQLARILYELRNLFYAELLESPSMLGDHIAARSWNATSRFQNFAQEKQIVGQIAAALLLQGEFGTHNLIHPLALKRIREDLDRERQAREWLLRARSSAKERVQVRGLDRGTKSSIINSPEDARTEVAELGVEPRLVLRPTDPSRVSWEVSLEIPDLSHLFLRFPQTRDILTGSRCVVTGASGRPLARGRCLHGTQRVTLSRWPQADEVLLRFEQSDPQLEYLLRTECLLRPGPTWLFRIATDGLAYECRSLRVRPGEKYIIVSTAGPVRSITHTSPINLSCDGVYGATLNLPQALTGDWEETLRQLGIGQSKTIEVWPAGLSAVVWDGEGHGEWLASERPCLGIRIDHPLASLLISIGSNANLSLDMTSVEPGEPIFVELPNLLVGLHRVHVSAQSSLSGQTELIGDLDVVMRIREALPWSPGVSPQGPLMVQIEPAAPTLEQLWEGRVEVSIRGPAGHKVKCRISLFERDGNPATVIKHLPPMLLPISENRWRAHFEKHFRRTRDAENFYDTARICELEFTADELGAFTVRCERDFTPLRWALRRQGLDYFVRLLDDSGDDAQSEVTRVAFETPCVEEKLGLSSEYAVPKSGGMYVARMLTLMAAVIAPPVISKPADLRCVPCVDIGTRSIESLLRVVQIANLWAHAKLTGDFISATRRRQVLLALGRLIAKLLCGDKWARVEEIATRDESGGIAMLKLAVSSQTEGATFAEIIARDCGHLAVATCDKRVREFAALANKFHLFETTSTIHVGDSKWLSELALRLASNPMGVEAWAGERYRVGHLRPAGTRYRAGLARLMELPTIARAARLFVLAMDRHLQPLSASSELYAGWEWT